MRLRGRVWRWAGAAALLTLLSGWLAVRSRPLSAPPPLEVTLPAAHPPPGLAVYQLPTGVTHRSAGFAYRGGSFFEKRDFAMTALLVVHPDGDLLIDAGLGSRAAEHLAQLPFTFRQITRYTRTRTAADQLRAAGYDIRRLRGIVLTHAHWDHASGVGDLPGVPVWLNSAERRFVETGGDLTAALRTTPGVRYEIYPLDGGPYLGFGRHHDIFGDGSVVFVPAPGHTPGSIVVFLTLPSGQRYALLGDLCWQWEGITLLEERPFPFSVLGDDNADEVREGLRHMNALVTRFPSLILVPAHDARGFSTFPPLPKMSDKVFLPALRPIRP